MKKIKFFPINIDWIIVGFLTVTPLVAAFGVYFLIQYGGIRWPTVVFSIFYTAATGLAITAGYHRLFSHRSYEASWPIKLVWLLLGAAGFENSALFWTADHRNHHKYVDTDLDPYNIKRGFWYAHIGWVLHKRKPIDMSNVADLAQDPWVRFQDRNYVVIAFLMGFGLPVAIGLLWGDPLGALILAGFARIFLNHHFTFSINSICHMLGTQPYSDRNTSRDNWLPALFTYGEGYHNYHHTFPSDYRNAIRPYQWDPTKWLIRTLALAGLTHSLRRIDEKRILEVRRRMEEKRLLDQLAIEKIPQPNLELQL